IPVDAELKDAADVEDETLSLDTVLARVAAAKRLQLVILDACRDNPFAPRLAHSAGTLTVATRGLARIAPERPNLFMAYAAGGREAALDGAGKNSVYANALVNRLAEPGIELRTVFRRVRDDVLAETRGKQQPVEYGSLTGDGIFLRPAANKGDYHEAVIWLVK